MEYIYRIKKGKMIKGVGLPAFIHNGEYYQTLIKVFEDNVIDCWGLVDFKGFKDKVAEGWVVTEVPAGEKIGCEDLYFGISSLRYYIKVEELVKEVWSILQRFRGKPTSSDICCGYFRDYLRYPNEVNCFKLKKAYENVPKHNRCFLLGDQDRKDNPIRSIIEGRELSSEIIEGWKKDFLK